MKDEVKEIISKRKQKIELNKFLNVQGYYDKEYDKEDELLLDCITNLQEENERLNNQYDLMENSLDEKQERIDKAIEYIKGRRNEYGIVPMYDGGIELIDILQGSDKDV